jgi:hypothetical protein
MFNLDEISEIIRLEPEFFIRGDNLKESERSIIETKDTWIVSLVNSLEKNDLKNIGNSFIYLDMDHYKHKQKDEWFSKEAYLLGLNLGRPPTSLEIINDAEKNNNMERYRLCYTLEYPHKTAFNMMNYNRHRDEVDFFLANASVLQRIQYPYFELICCNTLLIIK